MSTLPVPTSEAQYGYVVGRVIRAIADSVDADDKPDIQAASGNVTFTPKARLGRTSDYTAFVVREPIICPLDGQGYVTSQIEQYVVLTVGTYDVSFQLGAGASIPSFSVEVTAAHTQAAPLDLVTAAPYSPPAGAVVQTMLVPAGAAVGQVLSWTAAGLGWVDVAAATGGVSSVNGKTGVVSLGAADVSAEPAGVMAGHVGEADPHPQYVTAAELPDVSGFVLSSDARLSDARPPLDHAHAIADTTGLQAALDGKAASGHTHAELHTHANAAALALVSGTNTGDEPDATTTTKGVVELATTAEASAGTDTTRAVTPAGVAAVIAGVGGGVTDHGALTGLADDDHSQYALADGTRGAFAATSHTHTASQISDSTTTGRSVLTATNAAAARTAIGAGTSSLAIGTAGSTAAAGNRQATDTAIGMVELATTAEATAGTDTTRAVTPAGGRAAGDARYVRTVNGTAPDGSGNVVVEGGGGGTAVALPSVAWVARQVPLTFDQGGSGGPAVGGINLIPVWAPASRPIKRIAVECTAAASADALIELGFYDPVSLDLIVSMGTVNLATSTGGKVAQIGTAVLLPPLALLAVRLRSASLSGGKWRAGTVLPGPAAALMPGGNPWDSVGGGYMGWRIARAGTDALPAALPTTEWDVAAFNDGPVPFATLIPV